MTLQFLESHFEITLIFPEILPWQLVTGILSHVMEYACTFPLFSVLSNISRLFFSAFYFYLFLLNSLVFDLGIFAHVLVPPFCFAKCISLCILSVHPLRESIVVLSIVPLCFFQFPLWNALMRRGLRKQGTKRCRTCSSLDYNPECTRR